MTPDVVVVGGGPAGLTAAADLARDTSVLVLEREGAAGGIPRHSDHLGYGVRDLRRFLTGPDYARRLADRALAAGAAVRTSAMVTGWSADGGLELTSPGGHETLHPRAVLLATGARERPRPARLVPGDRAAGVYTTGQLQNLVHLHRATPGTRAVVVGAELVSWSAVLTLREAGCETVLLISEYERPESYRALTLGGRVALRAPVAAHSRVTRIVGTGRVEAVEVTDLRTGGVRRVECDCVVFTGDWIPDNELARAGELVMDAGSRGPVTDSALRTSREGVFAAGNLVHPVDTADVAALGGRHAAVQVRRWLDGGRPSGPGVRLIANAPLRWVQPAVYRPEDPAPTRGRLLLWSDEHVAAPRVVARQEGGAERALRVPWPAAPGRVFRVPWRLLDRVDPAGGDVHISV